MKRSTKIILFLALGFVAVGLALYGAAVAQTGRLNYGPVDLETLSPAPTTQVITDPVRNIQVSDISCDIRILPSADSQITVTYTDTELYRHEIQVRDGNLQITVQETGNFWNQIFKEEIGKQEVLILLPAQELENVMLTTVSGDISLPDHLTIGSLSLLSTSGNLTLEGTSASRSRPPLSAEIFI